jgi:hypothetical protein
MRIAFTHHPDRAFLRRGVLRTYFLVARDWARLGWFDWAICLALFIAITAHNRDYYFRELDPPAAATALAVIALVVIAAYGLARIGLQCASLWFGIHARPVATQVEIEPGRFIRCVDIADTKFDWSALRRAKGFGDMFVLLFRESPSYEVPVLVPRDALRPDEIAALSAALPR